MPGRRAEPTVGLHAVDRSLVHVPKVSERLAPPMVVEKSVGIGAAHGDDALCRDSEGIMRQPFPG